jgi:hypothetical protein
MLVYKVRKFVPGHDSPTYIHMNLLNKIPVWSSGSGLSMRVVTGANLLTCTSRYDEEEDGIPLILSLYRQNRTPYPRSLRSSVS